MSSRARLLALRFVTDVLDLPPAALPAHLGENMDELTVDTLCTMLGHPPAAPDGTPIPPGACCANRTGPGTPLVKRLPEFKRGASLRITMIDPTVPERSNVLSALGLVPGTAFTLRQTSPALVVEVGHTMLALDKTVAAAVLAKPAPAEDVPAELLALFKGVGAP